MKMATALATAGDTGASLMNRITDADPHTDRVADLERRRDVDSDTGP